MSESHDRRRFGTLFWTGLLAVVLTAYVAAYYSFVSIIVEAAVEPGVYAIRSAPRYSRNPTTNKWAARAFWPINGIDRKLRPSHWPNETGKGPLPSGVQF